MIRGYIQGCAVGGLVDKNFVSTYNAAIAAGIQRIDSYIFPCTGTQLATDHECKPPATQMSEYLAVIDDNHLDIDTLWLDIEQTDTGKGDPCNAWNLEKEANLALAREWVSLMEGSGRKWGIYANGYVLHSRRSYKRSADADYCEATIGRICSHLDQQILVHTFRTGLSNSISLQE